jgi:hypothetical protein
MGMLRVLALSATVMVSSLTSGQAFAINLVTNGSFETGTTAGWTASGACTWESLLAGHPTTITHFFAPTPTDGTRVLLSDTTSGFVTCTFQQDVAIPAGTSNRLTLDAGYNYFSITDPVGSGCSDKIEVTTTGGALIATVYAASGGTTQAIAARPAVDLTPQAGSTVRIIATMVTCDGAPGLILDNVVLNSESLVAIPTLGKWAEILLGLLLAAIGLAFINRRKTA